MRKFLQFILDQLAGFVGSKSTESPSNQEIAGDILDTIQLALYKQSAIHVICEDSSFTGDILQCDAALHRIILRQFQKDITSIIQLKDIKRVTLVPDSIKQSQTRE